MRLQPRAILIAIPVAILLIAIGNVSLYSVQENGGSSAQAPSDVRVNYPTTQVPQQFETASQKTSSPNAANANTVAPTRNNQAPNSYPRIASNPFSEPQPQPSASRYSSTGSNSFDAAKPGARNPQTPQPYPLDLNLGTPANPMATDTLGPSPYPSTPAKDDLTSGQLEQNLNQPPLRVASQPTIGPRQADENGWDFPTSNTPQPITQPLETANDGDWDFPQNQEPLEIGIIPEQPDLGDIPELPLDEPTSAFREELPAQPASTPITSSSISNSLLLGGPVQEPSKVANDDDLSTDRFLENQFEIKEKESTLWWKELVVQPLNPSNTTTSTDPNRLLYEALRTSPRIQAISKDPLIQELQITEAVADFDPVSFVRTLYDDRVDPVGNTLTTGGAPFLKDNIWTMTAGVRKKTRTGGTVEVGQKLGFQNSNSRFFDPQDQGTATLSLNFSQPLLRGAGQYVNRSQILIAQSANGVAWDVFNAELQDELQAVNESYWQLYYDRSVFLQKKRNVARGEKILGLLEGREELDSLPSQIARARAAVQSRRTELANAFRDVRNAETDVRRLINDPNWLTNQQVELLPTEQPVVMDWNTTLQEVVYSSLENRPEIRESVARAKIAVIQRDVSQNDLLPELNMLFGTYLAALHEDSGIERAWQQQFDGTQPGVSLGFEFEWPYRNRAARSRFAQSRLQLAKIRHEVDETAQNVISESQIAYRRLQSARQTLNAALESIGAARKDLEQNQLRWESFALVEGDLADGQTPTTVLDQLLDSQDRLAGAELVYAQAELENKFAETALRRAMGTLLQYQQVDFSRSYDCDTPTLHIHAAGSPTDGAVQATHLDSSEFPMSNGSPENGPSVYEQHQLDQSGSFNQMNQQPMHSYQQPMPSYQQPTNLPPQSIMQTPNNQQNFNHSPQQPFVNQPGNDFQPTTPTSGNRQFSYPPNPGRLDRSAKNPLLMQNRNDGFKSVDELFPQPITPRFANPQHEVSNLPSELESLLADEDSTATKIDSPVNPIGQQQFPTTEFPLISAKRPSGPVSTTSSAQPYQTTLAPTLKPIAPMQTATGITESMQSALTHPEGLQNAPTQAPPTRSASRPTKSAYPLFK